MVDDIRDHCIIEYVGFIDHDDVSIMLVDHLVKDRFIIPGGLVFLTGMISWQLARSMKMT